MDLNLPWDLAHLRTREDRWDTRGPMVSCGPVIVHITQNKRPNPSGFVCLTADRRSPAIVDPVVRQGSSETEK